MSVTRGRGPSSRRTRRWWRCSSRRLTKAAVAKSEVDFADSLTWPHTLRLGRPVQEPWYTSSLARSIPTRGNGSRPGYGRSIALSDGQSSGADTVCPGLGGSPTTASGSRAQPASPWSGPAIASTASRPRGPRRPSHVDQHPSRGEPGAVIVARRVRRAGCGNPPGGTPAGRHSPTQLGSRRCGSMIHSVPTPDWID